MDFHAFDIGGGYVDLLSASAEREKTACPTKAEDNFGAAAQIDRATRSHSLELHVDSAGDFGIVAANWSTP